MLHRLRALRRPVAPRVVTDLDRSAVSPVPHPAVAVRVPPGRGDGWTERLTAGQTEGSLAVDAPEAAYWLRFDGEPESLPAALVESLLLTAAAEGLPWVAGGWTAPAPGRFGPSGELRGFGDGEPPALVRLPDATVGAASGAAPGAAPRLIGRRVGAVTGTGPTDDGSDGDAVSVPWVRSGPHLLRPDVAPGAVVRRRVRPVDAVLAELPELPGPRTALFLLPFLAVGGAERLLLDLLEGFRDEYRLLVVTLEPHLQALGQRVDAVRAVTPHLYTLGDQLPREAHPGALRHLLRRYRVETLVCWNGAVDFYDLAPDLRRDFPELRILNQLYNHRGGWIERYSPALVGAVDRHLAVNRRIAEALERERGVPAERIALVHHGVRIPPLPTDHERAERRRRARERLGLPHDAVVAGTFIRLHPQKRPLDLLRLARRFAGRTDPPVHFLLAGGGPLDGAVDRELARPPLPNLLRLPMQRDVGPLYDALDLCLLTSAYEGLPIFLLDGLARGLPCVATAVGEVPELLADGGGVAVDRPGDLDALERAVEALLDPDRRRREGEAGRATVAARFGLDAYRGRYRELIFPRGTANE